jgi:hypothetical protein
MEGELPLTQSTKYFGEITFDESCSFIGLPVWFDNQMINLSFSKSSVYTEKLASLLVILDRYVEIQEVAKKAITENHRKNKAIKQFFKDTACGIEDLNYPGLIFDLHKNNEIIFKVVYNPNKRTGDILCIAMDKDLNIQGFSHALVLLD